MVGHRALDLARELAARNRKRGAVGILGGTASALSTRIGLDPNTLEEQVGALARDVATWLGGAATSIVAGLMSAVFIFIFTAITSYYLLREGAEGTSWLVEILTLPDSQVRQLVRDVTRAILVSHVMSLYQGVTAGIGYWIFGVDSPLVWASLTGIASILPAVGTAMVWAPICIVLAATGHVGKAVGVAAWSLLGWCSSPTTSCGPSW